MRCCLLDQRIQWLSNYVSRILEQVCYWFGYHDSQQSYQLAITKLKLERCNKELKATECVVTKCAESLQEFEMELKHLKKCIKEVISQAFDNTVPHEHANASHKNQIPSKKEHFDPNTKVPRSTSTTTVSRARLLQVCFPSITLLALIVYYIC